MEKNDVLNNVTLLGTEMSYSKVLYAIPGKENTWLLELKNGWQFVCYLDLFKREFLIQSITAYINEQMNIIDMEREICGERGVSEDNKEANDKFLKWANSISAQLSEK